MDRRSVAIAILAVFAVFYLGACPGSVVAYLLWLALKKPSESGLASPWVALTLLGVIFFALVGLPATWHAIARAKGATVAEVRRTLRKEIDALRSHAAEGCDAARRGGGRCWFIEEGDDLFSRDEILEVWFSNRDHTWTWKDEKPDSMWKAHDLPGDQHGQARAHVTLWRAEGRWVAEYRERLGGTDSEGASFELVFALD